jgi:hypothetical protein
MASHRSLPMIRVAGLALGVNTLLATGAFATTWVNPNTSGFTSLALNTPTPVDFLGTGDMTMTRTSAVGNSILLDTWSGTFAASVGGGTNPDWVLGTRSYFDLECNGNGDSGSIVSYEMQFAGGLAINSQLVFIDFDALEQVAIKAYDASDNLISFADTTILLSPGQDATPRYEDISWAASAGATGLLRNTNDDPESNVIASINSSISIYRLVYEFDFSQVVNSATIRFQIAATAVPGAGFAAMLAALPAIGGRRRRR